MIAKVSPITVQEIQNAITEYWKVLQASQLADKSTEDYFYFAYCFVRWMNGEFEPGGSIK